MPSIVGVETEKHELTLLLSSGQHVKDSRAPCRHGNVGHSGHLILNGWEAVEKSLPREGNIPTVPFKIYMELFQTKRERSGQGRGQVDQT